MQATDFGNREDRAERWGLDRPPIGSVSFAKTVSGSMDAHALIWQVRDAGDWYAASGLDVLRLSALPGGTSSRWAQRVGQKEERTGGQVALGGGGEDRSWTTPPVGRSGDAGHPLRESR